MKSLPYSPIWRDRALAIVRIIIGGMLIYHGQEIFHKDLMAAYFTWDDFKSPFGTFLVYAGKAAELIAGILLLLGMYTRIAALLCMGIFLYITFIVGKGKFWYDDQHPFLFVLFGFLFFFTGPGTWKFKV